MWMQWCGHVSGRQDVVLLLVHTAAAAPVRHAVVLDSSQGMCASMKQQFTLASSKLCCNYCGCSLPGCALVLDGFWLPKLMFVLSLEFHCRWPTHGWCDECAHCLQSMQRGSDSSWSSSSSQQGMGMGMVRVRVRRNPRTAAQQAVLCSRCRRICNVLL